MKNKDGCRVGFDTMDIYSPVGSKIIFSNPGNGYECQQKNASEFLIVDKEYTIKSVSVSQSSSTVELEELPGKRFNTVLFSNKQNHIKNMALPQFDFPPRQYMKPEDFRETK